MDGVPMFDGVWDRNDALNFGHRSGVVVPVFLKSSDGLCRLMAQHMWQYPSTRVSQARMCSLCKLFVLNLGQKSSVWFLGWLHHEKRIKHTSKLGTGRGAEWSRGSASIRDPPDALVPGPFPSINNPTAILRNLDVFSSHSSLKRPRQETHTATRKRRKQCRGTKNTMIQPILRSSGRQGLARLPLSSSSR
jgi:hypothetical protein